MSTVQNFCIILNFFYSSDITRRVLFDGKKTIQNSAALLIVDTLKQTSKDNSFRFSRDCYHLYIFMNK